MELKIGGPGKYFVPGTLGRGSLAVSTCMQVPLAAIANQHQMSTKDPLPLCSPTSPTLVSGGTGPRVVTNASARYAVAARRLWEYRA